MSVSLRYKHFGGSGPYTGHVGCTGRISIFYKGDLLAEYPYDINEGGTMEGFTQARSRIKKFIERANKSCI